MRISLLLALALAGCAGGGALLDRLRESGEPRAGEQESARGPVLEPGEAEALRGYVRSVRRKPFRYDSETERALDGLCSLKRHPAGFDALRRQYHFLEGLAAGTDRIETCLMGASSETVSFPGARDWYRELSLEVDEAKRSRPSLLERGWRGPATRYEADRDRYERLERLAAILSRLLPPEEVERSKSALRRGEAALAGEREKPAVLLAAKDYLVQTGRLGSRELIRLENGEGVLRMSVRFLEGEPPAADIWVEAFLPFRDGGVYGAARGGPNTLNLRLRADKAGERWIVKEP